MKGLFGGKKPANPALIGGQKPAGGCGCAGKAPAVIAPGADAVAIALGPGSRGRYGQVQYLAASPATAITDGTAGALTLTVSQPGALVMDQLIAGVGRVGTTANNTLRELLRSGEFGVITWQGQQYFTWGDTSQRWPASLLLPTDMAARAIWEGMNWPSPVGTTGDALAATYDQDTGSDVRAVIGLPFVPNSVFGRQKLDVLSEKDIGGLPAKWQGARWSRLPKRPLAAAVTSCASGSETTITITAPADCLVDLASLVMGATLTATASLSVVDVLPECFITHLEASPWPGSFVLGQNTPAYPAAAFAADSQARARLPFVFLRSNNTITIKLLHYVGAAVLARAAVMCAPVDPGSLKLDPCAPIRVCS